MSLHPPTSRAFKIGVTLGGTLFLYLLLTGIASLGLGDAIPTAVSRIVIGGILCASFGTAVVSASLGGSLETSIAAPFAATVGFCLFLAADTVFRLNATASDLPVEFTVLFYLAIALVGGGVAFLLGACLRWGSKRTLSPA